MDQGFDISVILCTINEIDNLPKLVHKIEELANFKFQLIFVDDGSTDGTRDFILEYCKTHKNTKFVFNPCKRSLLIAHYMGIKQSDAKYILIMDADLQHPVEMISDMYNKIDSGFDIVVASRFADGGSPGNRKMARGVISRVAEALAKNFIKGARKTSDPLSGFFIFKRSLNMQINEKWRGYKTLLYILAANPDAKVADVSYKFRERESGESKIVSGVEFIRIYITELILIKRIEIKALKK